MSNVFFQGTGGSQERYDSGHANHQARDKKEDFGFPTPQII